MSGGYFDYACYKAADESEIFMGLQHYKLMEQWLRDNSRHLAADEVYKFIVEVESAQRRLMILGNRISGLLHAVEWTASGDSRIDSVDKEYAKLIGKQEVL